MTCLKINNIDDGVVLSVKVVPASSKTAVAGLLNGMLKLKISAPPEKGKANQQLTEFLAKKLGLKKNAVNIISGQTNPVKKIRVSGINAETLLKKLDLNN